MKLADMRFDCRLYTGYKPCQYGNRCAGCPHYDPRPASAADPALLRPVLPAREFGAEPEVLLIKTGALGDVVRTTALLSPLLRRWPGARVTWATAPDATPLLVSNPLLAEVVALDDDSVAALARREFDLLFCFEKEGPGLRLAGLAGARARFGFAPTAFGTANVFNEAAAYGLILGLDDDLKFRHNRKTYPQIVTEMAELEYARDRYMVQGGADAARRRSEVEGQLAGRPGIRAGLNTGVGRVFQTKRWTLEGWCGLAASLAAHPLRPQILLLGGPDEEEWNEEIARRVPQCIATGCRNSLDEFIGVVGACDLLVTSDTLGMHLAIGQEKYTVVLFGSTSAVEIDLYDWGEKVVTDFRCSPCYLKTCNLDPMCMEAMSAETVMEAAARGLERIAARAAARTA